MFKTIDYFDDAYWELAQKLNLAEVDAALVAKGWIRQESENKIIYDRPAVENSIYGFSLPKPTEEFPIPVIFNAATNYARYYDKPIDDVFNEWLTLRYDHVRFHILTETDVDGTIPLGNVVDLAQGVVLSVSNAVKDVEAPADSHNAGRSSSVEELRRRSGFGQTEKGSYVVNVAVPVDEEKDAGIFASLKRRVFRRGLEHLTSTLATVERNANESDEDFKRCVQREGASANLLESFLKISFDGKADVEVGVDWSPLAPTSANVPSRAFLRREHAPKLRKCAQTLRPCAREETGEFYARVVALEEVGRNAVDGRPSGKVVFRIEDDSEGDYKADALLNLKDFYTACQAFYPSSTVAFKARVVRNGGKGTVEALENLRIVDDDY